MADRFVKLSFGDRVRMVRLERDRAFLDDRWLSFRPLYRDTELVALELEGHLVPIRVIRDGDFALVWCSGVVRRFQTSGGHPARVADPGAGLISPMPGRVRRILVSPGAPVERGQVLLILEAMKMEHAIRAPSDGIVTRLPYREGDLVEAGVSLAELNGSREP